MGQKFPFPFQRHELPDDSEKLKDLIVTLNAHYEEALSYLQSEIILLKRFRYGSRSESKKKPSGL